jgi:hypothetical protein
MAMINSTGFINNVPTDQFVERVSNAQKLFKANRAQGLKVLNDLFQSGTIPNPALNGSYTGELIALDIAPGFSQLLQGLLSARMPWKGKTFNAVNSHGDNVFDRSSFLLAHVLWPFYRGYQHDTQQTYRAFTFQTYIAPGKDDPDMQVLKIDYDLPGNPSTSIRRVLDELVQVQTGYYLGKAHLKWWWGKWQMVAYFSLRATANPV